MGRSFFTADTHFFHGGVIRAAGRPFASVDLMNEHMITCWNAVVKNNDTVWHLGDFGYRGDALRYAQVFARLNGTKHLIIGNHDNASAIGLKWASVSPLQTITDSGKKVTLCHYPLREWPYYFSGGLHLFGHCHNRISGSHRSMDVGVDSIGYFPLTLGQIQERMREMPAVEFRTGSAINYDLDYAE